MHGLLPTGCPGQLYLAAPRRPMEIQLDLFGSTRATSRCYPLSKTTSAPNQPPLLAVWGKNDPFFLPACVEASGATIPGGWFASSTAISARRPCREIAAAILEFLASTPESRRHTCRHRSDSSRGEPWHRPLYRNPPRQDFSSVVLSARYRPRSTRRADAVKAAGARTHSSSISTLSEPRRRKGERPYAFGVRPNRCPLNISCGGATGRPFEITQTAMGRRLALNLPAPAG